MSAPGKIRRALLSVTDKTGLVELAMALSELDVELISSGGTARALREAGLKVRDVADVTGFPEMMDGRVKTLHPKIHGGILGLRDNPEHVRQAQEHDVQWVDMVVVNLYPFAEVIARPGAGLADALENIDIGGPAMLRAAAKNFPHVTVVSDPSDYAEVRRELKERGGCVGEETRRALAVRTFDRTAAYDALVTDYLRGGGQIPPPLRKRADLRYGENPHQQASLYEEARPGAAGLAGAKQHGEGKELSYNNYLDLDAALGLALDLEAPAAVIVKHGNPCGAAEAGSLGDAFTRALGGDPLSAFGGVIALNRPLDRAAAERIAIKESFFEAIVAPGFDDGAVTALRGGAKWGRSLRILEVAVDRSAPRAPRLRSIFGGVLVQSDDTELYEKFESVTTAPDEDQRRDLHFAWVVCKHVKSNAIVLARNRTLVGLGAGQPSRVDSAHLAVRKAGARARGSVAASDAFFPFPDGVEVLIEAGVTAIAQPGGSVRDKEVIALARGRNIPMVITGTRHFRH